MKEKILEAFANLGFKLEDADGMGYVFDYEGIRFLYMYNENDENFLSIALPGFHDYDENNAAQYCILDSAILEGKWIERSARALLMSLRFVRSGAGMGSKGLPTSSKAPLTMRRIHASLTPSLT